jgi:2-succinyl-6-hydroxy-2,4-cyclohexadiene-1-carboxylate synthase
MAPTVVLLHGFTQTGRSWDPVVAGLGKRYRCLAPDIRGHGSRAELTPVALPAVLDDLRALIDRPVSLVGYSMGGRIALHAALALPGLVRRLVLIGASAGLEAAAERDQRRRADEALASEIEGMEIEAFADWWAATPVLAGQPPAVAAAVREDRLRNTPAGLARALRGLGTGALPSLWDRLPGLGIPVTLVVGERDAKFSALARRMAERLNGGAEVVNVPGAGHAVHLEAPDAVAATIAGGGP